MSKRFFIIGYYGSNNVGDELILESTIGLIRSRFDNADIRVLTYAIKETEQRFGVGGISRNDFKAISQAVKWCDVLVGGGGSMLQNVTSNRSLLYYLFLLNQAVLQKKKTILLGNGVGPIRGSFFQYLTFNLLKRLDQMVLRDQTSYDLLKRQGLTNISLGSDLAFNLRVPEEPIQVDKRIVLNLRPWSMSLKVEDWVPDFIKKWEGMGYTIDLLSMQTGKDDVLLQTFTSERVKCYQASTSAELVRILRRAEVVVAMRLHTLIFSAIAGTPFVGIGYDPKVNSFVDFMGQTLACDTNKMDVNAIDAAVTRTIKERAEKQEVLANRLNAEAHLTAMNWRALDLL